MASKDLALTKSSFIGSVAAFSSLFSLVFFKIGEHLDTSSLLLVLAVPVILAGLAAYIKIREVRVFHKTEDSKTPWTVTTTH